MGTMEESGKEKKKSEKRIVMEEGRSECRKVKYSSKYKKLKR